MFSFLLPPAYALTLCRERLIRLQHENKMLKLHQGEAGDEKVLALSGDLDLANSRINELETETR